MSKDIVDKYFENRTKEVCEKIADILVEMMMDNIDIVLAAYQDPPLCINGSQLRRFKKRRKVLLEITFQRIKRKYK